jgi:uncharacterized membrane protein HdeD (DUF308 family)
MMSNPDRPNRGVEDRIDADDFAANLLQIQQNPVRKTPHSSARLSGPELPASALFQHFRLSIGLRSATALLFAVGFLWPTLTETGLCSLFAAYAFLDGVLAVAPGGWSNPYRRGRPLLLGGWVGLAAAAAAYVGPAIAGLPVGNAIVVWAIAIGISFAVAGVTMRRSDPDYMFLLAAIASLAFGRAMLSYLPGDVVVVSTWTGLFTLTFGILLLKLIVRHSRPLLV